MARRTSVVFWAAVAAAAFLLGGAVSSLRSVLAGGGARDGLLVTLSAIGLAASLLVAGRIVFVVARSQRKGRARQGPAGFTRIERSLHRPFTDPRQAGGETRSRSRPGAAEVAGEG